MKTSTEIQEIKKDIKHLVLNKPEFLTYQAAAKYLNRSYGTVRNLVAKEALIPIKNGGFRYLRTSDLNAFMQGKLQNGRTKNKRASESSDYGQGEAAPDQVPQEQQSL